MRQLDRRSLKNPRLFLPHVTSRYVNNCNQLQQRNTHANNKAKVNTNHRKGSYHNFALPLHSASAANQMASIWIQRITRVGIHQERNQKIAQVVSSKHRQRHLKAHIPKHLSIFFTQKKPLVFEGPPILPLA